MSRTDNTEAVSQLFDRLHNEFGQFAPKIIQVMAETVGGIRLTLPSLNDLYRAERNRRICIEFDREMRSGRMSVEVYEELALKYRLKRRQVRRIVQQS